MDRQILKDILTGESDKYDKNLSHDQRIDIIKQGISYCDNLRNNLQPFSGEYNTIICIEELSELIKELTKALRHDQNHLGIIEELADVSLVVDYIKIIFNISDEELEMVKSIKMDRVKQRCLSKDLK